MTRDLAQEAFTVGRLAWMWQEGSLKPPPYEKSSADCLDDDFFYEYLNHLDDHIFEEYPEKEAYELAEATAKSRQKLFKDARDWPLPYLVASAVYKMLSTEGKQIHMISHLWRELLWPFLSFDEPFSDMVKAKGWGKPTGKSFERGSNGNSGSRYMVSQAIDYCGAVTKTNHGLRVRILPHTSMLRMCLDVSTWSG